jgi:hypothetical protein
VQARAGVAKVEKSGHLTPSFGRKWLPLTPCQSRKTVYEVIKLHAIGIRRYVKIKADANPYLPEYAEYFWYRRNKKGNKLLAAMSALELRAMNAA